MAKSQQKQINFEEALAKLERIVERLDDGNLPLSESLDLFKEGTRLAKLCRSMLSDAELQIKATLKETNDLPDAEPAVVRGRKRGAPANALAGDEVSYDDEDEDELDVSNHDDEIFDTE